MLNESKLIAVALLAATFIVGAVLGGVASAAWAGGDRDDRPRRMSYAERLDRELSLTPVQRESVEAILDRRRDAMHKLWREVEPRFDSLRQQIRGEILSVLDESQQTQLRELIRRSDSLDAIKDRRDREKKGDRRGRR